jgi:hypothetical protein
MCAHKGKNTESLTRTCRSNTNCSSFGDCLLPPKPLPNSCPAAAAAAAAATGGDGSGGCSDARREEEEAEEEDELRREAKEVQIIRWKLGPLDGGRTASRMDVDDSGTAMDGRTKERDMYKGVVTVGSGDRAAGEGVDGFMCDQTFEALAQAYEIKEASYI